MYNNYYYTFNMQEIGRTVIVLGIILALIGSVLSVGDRLPFIGKLPGDILIKRDNFTFFAPITTSIIISLVLTLIVNIIARLKG